MWSHVRFIFRFYRTALAEEFKRSRGYKTMSVLWAILAVLSVPITYLTLVVPVQLAPPSWFWRIWYYFLGLLFFGLLLLVFVAVYRYHTRIVKDINRTIDEIKADYNARSERIQRLSELHGRGNQILHGFSSDEVPARTLRVWSDQIRKALFFCYDSSLTKFGGEGGYYMLEVPDEKPAQADWLYATLNRLEDLIKEELPPPEKIDTSYLPDEAFMT